MKLLVAPELLLPRDSSHVISDDASREITGKVVMVTGAGGSIGSEIVRQCRLLGAERIVKVDNSENALFMLSHQLFDHALFGDSDDLHSVDITNYSALSHLVQSTQPDVIFHAAAKKHLSLIELHPESAINVNVLGTQNVVKAALNNDVPKVVNISTDKAADPASSLGWSKRIAELIGAHYSSSATCITSVRFGNVLGSQGSLLYSVQESLQKGLPIPITHREVSRYFMTIPEATGLVIEAAHMSNGGDVFVLNMEQSIKIVDLVYRFAELADFPRPKLEFIGLRPGEKLHETPFSSQEVYQGTSHPRINTTRIVDKRVGIPHLIGTLSSLVLTTNSSPTVLRDALNLNLSRKEDIVTMDRRTGAASVTRMGAH